MIRLVSSGMFPAPEILDCQQLEWCDGRNFSHAMRVLFVVALTSVLLRVLQRSVDRCAGI